MKRLFLFFCLIFCASFSLRSEDGGRYIMMFDNSGEAYFVPEAAVADSASAAAVLKRNGNGLKLDGIKLDKEQQRLILSDIDGVDYNPAWRKYSSWRKAGLGMTIGGGVLGAAGAVVTVGGLACFVVLAMFSPLDGGEAANGFAPVIEAGMVGMGAGVVCCAAGIPILVVNNRKMTKITKKYNGATVRKEKELIFGSTPNGVGFALNF